MIEAHQLTRRYGDFTATKQVSFAVDEGEIVGILGPNGAGKTTIIRMITGFLPPNEGRVTVAGVDLFAEPAAARRQIGYLPENVALYGEMRVSEYLAYRAQLEGMSRVNARRAIPETIERCLITDVARQIIGTLSKGYRQRVGLAAAILHGPKVLVLDEPTIGLDPKQIIAIRELIRDLGKQQTLLLSTHILPEVELLCDRVIIIDRGRLVAEGTPQSLRERWVGAAQVLVTLAEAPTGALEILRQVPGVAGARPHDGGSDRFLLEAEPQQDPRAAVFRAAVDNGWTLLELSEAKASLEEVFVRLTTQDVDDADDVDDAAGPAEGPAEPAPTTKSEEVPS